MYQSEIEKLKAEAAAHRKKNADATTSSQTIAKPNVVRRFSADGSSLDILSQAIREKLSYLKELKTYTEIIVPRDFSQQHLSYTIINIMNSNSYRDNKKSWEGDILHDEITQIVTVKNNAISYDLERYAVKDCIYYGQPIMLNDVLQYLKVLSQEMYGETDLRLYNHFAVHFLGTWDMSSPYLKDQNIVMSDRLVVLYNGVS